MQKLFTVIILASLFYLSACHTKETKQEAVINNNEEPQFFFPVTEFILGQLREIDSLPVTPLEITTDNDIRDSVWLKRADVRTFAKPFLSPVIDSNTMQSYFVEKSFLDQTINAITLSYDPVKKLPDSIKLNHWDVYIDPQKNTVQRIYMVKEENTNGTTITTHLTWKAGKSCSITTIKQQPKMAPEVKSEIVKWDLDD
ncbi:MAG TPA: hypothetical protein VLM16_09180 [Ginsengibacter sp.]|nr:hypothetical protein [Ginsengibacter sp.]